MSPGKAWTTLFKSCKFNSMDTSLSRPESKLKKLAGTAVLSLLLGLSRNGDTYALEAFDSVQIHGFASQSMFLTSGNNMFGPSISKPNFDFTELGVNASWVPLPNLRLAMQVLSRRAGGLGNDGAPDIDFGLIDYGFNFDNDYRFGIRAGRVRVPYGLYNDTRDVAFTRPSILLPQSIYFESSRSFTISTDGLLLYAQSSKPWGNLTLEVAGSYPRSDNKDTQYDFLGRVSSGTLRPNPGVIGRLNYESYDKSLRFALTGARISMDYHQKYATDQIPKGDINFDPVVISAQYNAEKFSLTSEYSYWLFNNTSYNLKQNGESYYFQAAYRFYPQWEVMARYDAFYLNTDDESGKAFRASGQGPAFSQFAKYWTVGLRYDINRWTMIRAEYSYINGTALLPPQGFVNHETGIPEYSKTTQYWDMFGLLVSFRF